MTQRTTAAIAALLADNSTALISPQDLRDALDSWRNGHGQIYVPAAAAAAVTISDTTSYFEATAPAWTLSAGGHMFDESGGNGRLTYIGNEPMTAHIALSMSMTVGGTSDITHWRIGVNGTPDEASEIQRKVGTGADVGALAAHLITTVTNGDYISVWCRNSSNTDDITVETANLQVVSMIQ